MEQGGLPVQRFGAENIASDITCGIGEIRAHIYRAQTAQELPKKHHEAGLPEQLPTDAVTRGSRVDERRIRARFLSVQKFVRTRVNRSEIAKIKEVGAHITKCSSHW